jgi:SWI/SNF chromatin-remodeling complex subunit SWI1
VKDRVPRRNDELGAVDLEAIAMSMASRLPHEVSYALAVLAMLSVPEPGETQHGLDLHHYPDLLLELLDLIADSAFGEDGWEAWRKRYEACGVSKDPNDFTHNELVAAGTDISWWGDAESATSSPRETAIVIAGINLLRNYSMADDNQAFFARTPQLLQLLATVIDARLCRIEPLSVPQPYTYAELCRVRKDVLQILANLGSSLDLRTIPLETTQSLLRLIYSVVADALEQSLALRPLFGPASKTDESVPLNLDHALDAFSHFALPDSNREVLARLPAQQLVSLFSAFMKLLPITRQDFELLQSSDTRLGHVECVALCLFHLAFLAPLAVRTDMRQIPGTLAIITRIIFDYTPRGGDFSRNPFNVLCRRLCETLGCLNQSSVAEAPSMSFSAGAGDGWKPGKAKSVEPGLLAAFEDSVVRTLSVDKIDPVAFNELDALLWAQAVDS